METFPFPYYELTTEYPESSTPVKFGRGYEFVSAPEGPEQITYRLKFPGLWWLKNAQGALDATINPERNMKALEEFYERHLLYRKFLFNHPYRGLIEVRFSQPLSIPPARMNSHGLVEGVELKVVTVH